MQEIQAYTHRNRFRVSIATLYFLLACVFPSKAEAIDYEPQPEKAMIMIVCAHPDDEGIFFGGILAYYTQVLKVPTVLICTTLGEYAYDNSGELNPGQEVKPIEFPVCVKRYGFRNEALLPLFQQSKYNDTVARSWQDWSNGPKNMIANNDVAIGKQTMSRYLAEQIRIFQPEVLITLSQDGEYGHPNHKCMYHASVAAWDLANGIDASITDEAGTHDISATGIIGAPWQVKKLYAHRYGSNRLFHDFGEDVSIDTNGDGVPDQSPRGAVEFGLSYLTYTGNADVATVFETGDTYDPYHSEYYGLVRTTVGYDTVESNFTVPGDTTGSTYSGWARGDFLENISYTYDAAENPMPRDFQTDLHLNPQLTWKGGSGSTLHDVYFGTSHAEVAIADTSSVVYQGRQNANSFSPSFLSKDMVYYWRVDEVKADSSVVRGMVWRFSTVSTTINKIMNGGFEVGDFSQWSVLNWAGASGFSIASSSSLSGSQSATSGQDGIVRAITQDFSQALVDFTYEMQFRIDSYGVSRAMDWNISSVNGGASSGALRFKIDSGGISGLDLNGQSGWVSIKDDESGEAFVPVLQRVYRWQISGTHFDNSTVASFEVRIFEDNIEIFTSTNNSLTSVTAAPVKSVSFVRGGNWGGGGYSIDDLTIVDDTPPPAGQFTDIDADGLADEWEEYFFGDADGVASLAEISRQHGGSQGYPVDDGDQLDNQAEYLRGTDPTRADTDMDGINDDIESNTGIWISDLDTGTSPLDPDSDGDGLEDAMENPDLLTSNPFVQYNTDPNQFDTDSDGHGDGKELDEATDPSDFVSNSGVVFPLSVDRWGASYSFEDCVGGDFSGSQTLGGNGNWLRTGGGAKWVIDGSNTAPVLGMRENYVYGNDNSGNSTFTRLNNEEFGYRLNDTGVITISFLMRQSATGDQMFGLASDVNENGQIETSLDEICFAFGLSGGNWIIQDANLNTSFTEAHGLPGTSNNTYQVRLVINPSANSGDASASFFFRNISTKEKWQRVTGLGDVNLSLRSLPPAAQQPSSWNGIFLAIGDRGCRVDQLHLEQQNFQATPRPGIYSVESPRGFGIRFSDLDPRKIYQLKRGSDLSSFPENEGLPFSGRTQKAVLPLLKSLPRTFYRIEEINDPN